MSSETQHISEGVSLRLRPCIFQPQSSGSLMFWLDFGRANAEQDKGNSSKPPIKGSIKQEKTNVYNGRWLVLFIFCCFSSINSFQWIQYSTITTVIAKYYGVSNLHVNLTSMVYMITYILFIIPASLMLKRLGLRRAILLGTLCTALGSYIKWQFGGAPSLTSFWWMMAGQTIVALSQLYILSIPPLLAAVWFPDKLVSTATRIGVLGNQLGIALGFIVPPKLIRNPNGGPQMIGEDLNLLSAWIFWISLAICVISELTFEDKPPEPPGSSSSHAAHKAGPIKSESSESVQMERNDNGNQIQTFNSIKQLCRDEDFMLLVLSYGMLVGCFYAISTLLNQMVSVKCPNQIHLAGTMGFICVVSGLACFLMLVLVLYKSNAHNVVTIISYLCSIISLAMFIAVLNFDFEARPRQGEWLLYISPYSVGSFMTSYLVLGFGFASKIAKQHPANLPAALLNLSAQVFGLILTLASLPIVDQRDNIFAITLLIFCLGNVLILIILRIMRSDLKRRQEPVEEECLKV